MNFKTCVSVSLNRSGSTFFVTALNTFPNVVGDFEVNITPDVPTPYHRTLERSPLDEILAEIERCQNNGNINTLIVSKIVVAPQHTFSVQEALEKLVRNLSKIDNVVVILRPWFEQFLSKFLGSGHLADETLRLPRNMRNFYSNREMFDDRFKYPLKSTLDRRFLETDLHRRRDIQLNLLHPLAELGNVTFVDYCHIADYLTEFLANFTSGDKRKIRIKIAESPTKKIHSPTIRHLFNNFSEVKKMQESWADVYNDDVGNLKKSKLVNYFEL